MITTPPAKLATGRQRAVDLPPPPDNGVAVKQPRRGLASRQHCDQTCTLAKQVSFENIGGRLRLGTWVFEFYPGGGHIFGMQRGSVFRLSPATQRFARGGGGNLSRQALTRGSAEW